MKVWVIVDFVVEIASEVEQVSESRLSSQAGCSIHQMAVLVGGARANLVLCSDINSGPIRM
jgi:hypothetical protein